MKMLDIEKPELLNILEGPASLHGSFTCRPSHALVFKLSGESIYHFANKTLLLHQGQMLFVPRSEVYSFGKVSAGESRYILINFRGQVANAQPQIYDLAAFMDFDHFCNRLRRVSLLETTADRYRALSLFYQALECVCEAEKLTYLHTAAAQKLEPAVEVLREKLYDPALKIGQLHTSCGVSDTYFRKLFIARFGVNPKRYVLMQRLRRAKALLDHGEYNSIAQVAALSGFDDPLHFSKLFRQTYGCPPSANRA